MPGYGLLQVGQDQFNRGVQGLQTEADLEAKRDINNAAIKQQGQQEKQQLGAAVGSLGGAVAGGALAGSAAGPVGTAVGAVVGAIAGMFGAQLF